MKILISILLFATSDANQTDFFSSTFETEILLQNEIAFIKELKTHLSMVKRKVQSIELFLESYHQSFDLLEISDTEGHVSNPINSFGVISRTMNARSLLLSLENDTET